MIGLELARELIDGVWIAGEQPATERRWEPIEIRGCSRYRINRGGDGFARIKHRVELGDPCIGIQKVCRNRIEDQFPSTASDQPIMRQRNSQIPG